MRKLTFTIYTHDNKVYGYLFEKTRVEAQAIVSEMNKGKEQADKYYYMDGYREE